jgi:hypothetical protein
MPFAHSSIAPRGARRVGAERLASSSGCFTTLPPISNAGFSTPPTKPDVPLSWHPAFQGPAFLARDYHGSVSCFDFAFIVLTSKDSGYCLIQGAFPLPPFALWPAFPTSDYYEGSDSAQVSTADCWPASSRAVSHVHDVGLCEGV